jgi:hypothetical protein
MSPAPKKLRKQYVNQDHKLVMLRFEDGHEIKVYRGTGKTFNAYAGETIKILAMDDPDGRERDLIESRKADDFEDAS